MNIKRFFIIAIVLLVLVVGALLIYNFFFKNPTEAQPQESPGGALPSSPADRGGLGNLSGGDGQSTGNLSSLKIKPVSQEKVLSASIGEDGQTVKYYAKSSGNVYESDFDGNNLKKISSVSLANLVKALWSPDKQKVIGIFSDNGKIKKYFYDYNTNQSSLLNDNIGYIAWSPDSKKIAYQYSDPTQEQGNISISNPDGTGYKNIFKTRLDNLVVEWPAKDKISIFQPPSGLAQGILYAINSNTGDFTRVLSDLFGLSVKWSPKADKILFSSTNGNGRGPHLTLADETGTHFKELKVSGLADKCVWSKDDKTVLCALPQEMSEYATWPDDYYKGLIILKDDFYKIDLETGQKTKILGSSDTISYDAQELFLSPKEDYLFFINRGDGLLYSLKL